MHFMMTITYNNKHQCLLDCFFSITTSLEILWRIQKVNIYSTAIICILKKTGLTFEKWTNLDVSDERDPECLRGPRYGQRTPEEDHQRQRSRQDRGVLDLM